MRHSILFYSIAVVVSALSHQAMVASAAEELGYGTLLPEEYDRPGDEIDADIKDMVSKMTLEEKIGQMTQLNQDLVLGADGVLNETAVEYYAQNYYVGSYLNQLARYVRNCSLSWICCQLTFLFLSDGINYDHGEYADLIERIQEITLAANSTYKIPIIYGYVVSPLCKSTLLTCSFCRLDHIHGAHYVAKCKILINHNNHQRFAQRLLCEL